MADHVDDAVKAVTALQFNAPWDPWGLTPDEARTVIDAAMPHIRAQIAADLDEVAEGYSPMSHDRGVFSAAARIARGES